MTDFLPPPVNKEKLNDYVNSVSGRSVIPTSYEDDKQNLHLKYVNPVFLQEIGKLDKYTHLKNRRKRDQSHAAYEVEKGVQADGQWGLTEPNKEAYYKNVAKFCKAQVTGFDVDAWNFAEQCVIQHFYPHLKESGIESTDESIARLDLSKSPGPPWSFMYKTKAELVTDPQFKQKCEQGWDWLLESDRWWLTGTALKEEVRPSEKLMQNKQRIFTPQSADLNVLTNRLCGQFNDNFTDCHMKTWSMVGINPFQGGWNRLHKKLTPPDKPNMVEGDYGDWDSSLAVHLMFFMCRFRFMCLPVKDQTKENYDRLFNLYKNIAYSVLVLIDGTLVIKPGGNPSGSANTVVDNTIINFFALAYCWYRLCPVEDRTYVALILHVVAALYGDDNTGAMTDHAAEFYKPSVIPEVMKEIGLTLNFEDKEFQDITKVHFLQADFNTKLYGNVIYHVDPAKSYESIRWSEEPTNPAMSLIRACGMRLITWSDDNARDYYQGYIDWLMDKYDPMLFGSEDWEGAKSSYKTDWEMGAFYAGLECKDQKDNQTCETMSIFFEGQARNKKNVKKNNRAAPQRKRAAPKKKTKRRVRNKRNNKSTMQQSGASMRISSAPVATSTQVRMGRRANSRTLISEFEFLSSILGSQTFVTTQYSINPGLFNTFPWLSAIADRFELYTFLSLEFLFVTTSPTSVTGSISMAVDPDVEDPPPTTKQQMMTFNGSVTDVAWKDISIRVPPKSRFAKDLFIRSGSVSNTDQKTYDLGNFYIATQGQANNTTQVGELYVRYKVALISPQLTNVGSIYGSAYFASTNGTPTIPFPALHTSFASSGSIVPSSTNTSYTLLMPANAAVQYWIHVDEAGAGMSSATFVNNGTNLITQVEAGTGEDLMFAGLTQASSTGILTFILAPGGTGYSDLETSFYATIIQNNAPLDPKALGVLGAKQSFDDNDIKMLKRFIKAQSLDLEKGKEKIDLEGSSSTVSSREMPQKQKIGKSVKIVDGNSVVCCDDEGKLIIPVEKLSDWTTEEQPQKGKPIKLLAHLSEEDDLPIVYELKKRSKSAERD